MGVPRPADNGGPYPPAPTHNRSIQTKRFYVHTNNTHTSHWLFLRKENETQRSGGAPVSLGQRRDRQERGADAAFLVHPEMEI